MPDLFVVSLDDEEDGTGQQQAPEAEGGRGLGGSLCVCKFVYVASMGATVFVLGMGEQQAPETDRGRGLGGCAQVPLYACMVQA